MKRVEKKKEGRKEKREAEVDCRRVKGDYVYGGRGEEGRV
jgi:hypothetical protein